MKSIGSLYFAGLCIVSLLTACGGGGSGSENVQSGSNQPASEQIQIVGAGIKGPLAFADAKIYLLDPTFPEFYDVNSPISSAITNASAQITGLSVPADSQPPYVLTIGGNSSIDLNTGKAPVINTLVTVITADMLSGNKPIYTTPLTTLAFHMARHDSNSATSTKEFVSKLYNAAPQVSSFFSIDPTVYIDIFSSPLVINASTVTVAEQKEAVHHRAALEAFAAKIYDLSLMLENISTDVIIDRLALDLQSDGVIDNAANGTIIGGIDTTIINQKPLEMTIPNTTYQVNDIIALMSEERILIGTSTESKFLVDEITLPTAAAPTPVAPTPVAPTPVAPTPVAPAPVAPTPVVPAQTTTFPLDLRNAVPEEASISVNVEKPENSTTATIRISAIDADHQNEGELIINGNPPVALFGAQGISTNNTISANITISTPESYWNNGNNSLKFRHTSSGGFVIESLSVTFQVPSTNINKPILALSINNLNFGTQDIGGMSNELSVSLNNTGSAPFSLSSISISTDFIENNSCSNFIPVGGNCTFSISFIPSSEGTISGALVISDNTDTYSISLTGVGNTSAASAPVATPPTNTVLYVDFENHPGGTYTKQNAMQDFNANESTEGIVIVDTDIVSDPSSNPSRGKVMRVTHRANRAGSEGGFRFKARFPPADEYYMAFDIFIPDNYELIAAEKMPGLMYGTLLDASHAYEVLPTPEGVKAFSVMHQLLGAEPYSGLGENKFSSYVYDADVVMRDIIFDTATPETNVTSGSNPPDAQTLWRMPKGQWVRIEQRVKQNTATSTDGVGDLRDGIIQEWVNGQLMVDSRRRFRSVNTMRIDGIFMYSYYGGDPTDAINRPAQTQFEYYDNFIVSTSRITR
ncbi:MAG: choice-of-anchor D domain-containing protein [Gammaproteobacteria bacterium]|nr:choice-of-anchor D domain-containing protein [Gammaproteobacteria bacterium]